jgi:amidase
MARSVGDVAVMFDAIAGHDPKDSTSLADPPSNALAAAGQAVEGLRIGIDRSYASTNVDAGQVASIEAALKVLEGLGARIVEVKMPDLSGMLNIWLAICAPEALAEHKANYPSRAAEYGPYFRDFLAAGATMTPAQVADAQAGRAKFSADFSALLESVDVMACPAGGAPAFPVSRELQLSPIAEFSAAWGKASPRAPDFTMPMNLAGTPAICLPSGFSPEGLPYSIQFAGRRLSEPTLCRIASAYERATTWHERHPNI